MRMVDCIEKKAAGLALESAEIREIIDGYVDGSIPDYQMSALLMAIVLRGMTMEETTSLTMAMMHSGDVCDLSDISGVKVDKHSTGGVGDTTTLVIGPLVAACGGKVAKMSGRGLGHTGGTLDKLESIPGMHVEQPLNVFRDIVKRVGISVIGQSENLDPADKKIYALRDVTATVGSIPLIVSSIMSKKLAAGADAIVLDVKLGSGAFMHTLEQARELSRHMVQIGQNMGRRCVAVISDMNQPLGLAVGNALEVRDAVLFLSGLVPSSDPLYQVSMCLGEQMLILGGLADDELHARNMLEQALKSGAALSKLQHFVAAQGGDASFLNPERIDGLCRVKRQIELPALSDGYLCAMETEQIGTAAQMLGAGRATKQDVIDPSVGILFCKRIGDRISRGDPLCTLYVNDENRIEEVRNLLYRAIRIDAIPAKNTPLIYDIITA